MFIHRIFTRIHKLKNTEKFISTSRRNFPSKHAIVNNTIYTSKRNLEISSWGRINPEKLKRRDEIPNNFQLVYRSTMSSYLYAAQISASAGIVFILGSVVVNYCMDNKDSFLINLTNINLSNIMNTNIQMATFSIGFLLINIAVLILISKFPIRIYYNAESKKCIGVLFSKIPKKTSKIEFNAGELMFTPKSGILPWSDNKYKLKDGRNLILLDHYFRKPEDLNVMLGYTKL